MVIQNSEVSMTSKSSYSSTTKATYQVTKEPAFSIGIITFKQGEGGFLSSLNYALSQDGQVQQVGDDGTIESVSANRQTRMQTMQYLLRVLLLGKIFSEKSGFGQMLQQMFAENSGFITTTTVTYEHEESQEVSYMAKGTAVTADGRRLQFDYGFEMSESFHEEFQSVQQSFSNFIDPLVINLNDSPTKVANQTFYFDLDGDGKAEEINRLAAGSGFLALDRNGDGEINDGSELFGTKTGDGFKELEIFDEDGNGWIDENDPIFEKLRVWTMNENGEMELYTLKQSDVGAIYLGRVRTDFVQHDSEHKAMAAIRESGIYLHESDGHASQVSHVDFAT